MLGACILASNAGSVGVDLLVSRIKRSVQGGLVHLPVVARQISLGRQKDWCNNWGKIRFVVA